MQIKDYRHDYHRNGIGGEGSHVAFFRARLETPHGWTPMMAVLWGHSHSGTDEPTECMVMRLDEITAIAELYLAGETPESVGDSPWDSTQLSAWRSTDHFLYDLLPHYRREFERENERIEAALSEAGSDA